MVCFWMNYHYEDFGYFLLFSCFSNCFALGRHYYCLVRYHYRSRAVISKIDHYAYYYFDHFVHYSYYLSWGFRCAYHRPRVHCPIYRYQYHGLLLVHVLLFLIRVAIVDVSRMAICFVLLCYDWAILNHAKKKIK